MLHTIERSQHPLQESLPEARVGARAALQVERLVLGRASTVDGLAIAIDNVQIVLLEKELGKT